MTPDSISAADKQPDNMNHIARHGTNAYNQTLNSVTALCYTRILCSIADVLFALAMLFSLGFSLHFGAGVLR